MHMPLHSYIVKVYKVFKGNLKSRYIELPVVVGTIDGTVAMISDGVSMLNKGETGMFFLAPPPYKGWDRQFYNSGDKLAHHHILSFSMIHITIIACILNLNLFETRRLIYIGI
jgi:hypothetical protein